MLHGRPSHAVSTLRPSCNKRPRYAQLYIYDPVEAAELRAQAYEGLRRDTLEELAAETVAAGNPYPGHFRRMHDVVEAAEHLATSSGRPLPWLRCASRAAWCLIRDATMNHRTGHMKLP